MEVACPNSALSAALREEKGDKEVVAACLSQPCLFPSLVAFKSLLSVREVHPVLSEVQALQSFWETTHSKNLFLQHFEHLF